VELLASAKGPQTSVRAPFDWNGDPNWRGVYNYVGPENQEKLRAEGEHRRARMAKRPKREILNS
jgi:hypothetical protein